MGTVKNKKMNSNLTIKSHSPSFLITEVNSSYNKGDAAIVLGILKIIHGKYPLSSVTVLTPTPIEDKKYYSKYNADTHVQLYDSVGRKIPKKGYKITYLIKMSIYLIWTKLKFLPIPKKNKLLLELYQKADVVISCSGGRLGGKKFSTIYDTLIPIYFAKKLGKKVFVCAQSVEPFQSNFIRNITKFVLNKVDPHSALIPFEFLEFFVIIDLKFGFFQAKVFSPN